MSELASFDKFRVWKRAAPCLYDIIIAQQVDSSLCSMQWTGYSEYTHYSMQQFLFAGNYSSEKSGLNPMLVTELKVPKIFDSSILERKTLDKSALVYPTPYPAFDFNPDYDGACCKLNVNKTILIKNKILGATANPKNSKFVAVRLDCPDIHLYDTSSKSTKSVGTLVGHSKSGKAFAWSSTVGQAAQCISGSDDKKVCLWDVKGSSSTLVRTYDHHHSDSVQCLAWQSANLFASGGKDRRIMIFDVREKRRLHALEAHRGSVECLSFQSNFLLSGSSDKSVALWDVRNLKSKLHSFESHADKVTCVSFNPYVPTQFLSASCDRTVAIWDICKIGEELVIDELEDGPPELVFVHGGHTSAVINANWLPEEKNVVSSIADNGVFMFWKPRSELEEFEPKANDLE